MSLIFCLNITERLFHFVYISSTDSFSSVAFISSFLQHPRVSQLLIYSSCPLSVIKAGQPLLYLCFPHIHPSVMDSSRFITPPSLLTLSLLYFFLIAVFRHPHDYTMRLFFPCHLSPSLTSSSSFSLVLSFSLLTYSPFVSLFFSLSLIISTVSLDLLHEINHQLSFQNYRHTNPFLLFSHDTFSPSITLLTFFRQSHSSPKQPRGYCEILVNKNMQ